MRFPWDKDEHEEAGDNDDEVDGSRIGSVGSARRVDPRVFLSTGSEPSTVGACCCISGDR